MVFQSTGVGQSTYDCNWYDLPSRHAVLLIIVIRRANESFQITAGKFSPFSLELFNAVSRNETSLKLLMFKCQFKRFLTSGIENIGWISFRVAGNERQTGRREITRTWIETIASFYLILL